MRPRLPTALRWERAFPDSAALREERADFEVFRGLPDQRHGPRRQSQLAHDTGDDFFVPVSVNGKTARYLVQTGAWASLIAVGEAKHDEEITAVDCRSPDGGLA